MALSLVSGSKSRYPHGNRWKVCFTADEVDATGDEVPAATIGLSSIDSVVAVCKEANVAVRAHANSTDGNDTSNGAVFLQTGSGTHDIYVEVIGR
jgi:hypothetical protein